MFTKFSAQAKAKLTRLGMGLLFLYALLAVLGWAGMGYGIVVLIQHFLHAGTVFNAFVLQTILLIMICGFMVKVFLRECHQLLETDSFSKLRSVEEVNAPILHSNVIPFRRR